MSHIRQQIVELAHKRRARVAIGLLRPTDSIVNSLRRAAEFVDITVIGSKIEGHDHIEADATTIETRECEVVLSGRFDGLIRGQADTYRFEDALAKMGNYDRSKILGFSLIEDQHDRAFFTTSGSHSDGWRVPHKKIMVEAIMEEMKHFGLEPRLGFLTWVRPGSVGRNFFFDQTWDHAEELVAYYSGRGVAAKNYNIEIETALADGVNLLVVANGTSGNMLARALTFLAKDMFMVYAHLGVKENIVENNRTLQDYYNMFLFAAARANRGAQNS